MNGPIWFSQFGEDRWIVEHLALPVYGTFVEVGAADGVENSNTLYFERAGWRGILIEPDPRSYPVCKINRPIATVYDCAIGSTPGRAAFVLDKEPTWSGLARTEGMRHPVMVRRLDELLGGKSVDLLSIDTEGTEIDVFESLGEIRPSIIIAEFNTIGLPDNGAELSWAIVPKGYALVHRSEVNLIFVKSH